MKPNAEWGDTFPFMGNLVKKYLGPDLLAINLAEITDGAGFIFPGRYGIAPDLEKLLVLLLAVPIKT